MKKVISIVKDFLYSAFIAVLPTLLITFVYDVIYGEKVPSFGYGWWFLIVFLISTVVIFIIRRQDSKKINNIVGLIFLLGGALMIIFIQMKGRTICRQVGGQYVTLGRLDSVRDIKGNYHSGDRYGLEKVCYITKEKLKGINPDKYSYRYADFVIKD